MFFHELFNETIKSLIYFLKVTQKILRNEGWPAKSAILRQQYPQISDECQLTAIRSQGLKSRGGMNFQKIF